MLILFQPSPVSKPNPPGDQSNIPLWDEFSDVAGRFINYDAHDTEQRNQLNRQQHVNIRSFENDDLLIAIPMFYLDLLPMSLLNNQRMIDLEGSTVVKAGERWTNASVAKDPLRKNWRVLSMECVVGINITESTFYN